VALEERAGWGLSPRTQASRWAPLPALPRKRQRERTFVASTAKKTGSDSKPRLLYFAPSFAAGTSFAAGGSAFFF
jgi:hypothetical protein